MNFSFRFPNSKSLRINLNSPIKIEEKKEEKAAHAQIDEDRSFLIQATIVRIMKARKVSTHQELLTETISQLSSKFKINVSMIKVLFPANRYLKSNT